MNQVDEYLDKINAIIPEFSEYWNSEEAQFNFGAESRVHGVFSDFSALIIQKLKTGTLENPQQLFSFIEAVVIAGGDSSNAACTCFLENILNRVPDSIDPVSFVPHLGSASAEFCRGWDKFTGTSTVGL